MSIYINDSKKKTVRYYCTTSKIEKAIETLLRMNEELIYSETHEGYEVEIKESNLHGTPIPDNVTNGDVIKAMFDVKEIDMSNTYCVHFPEEEDYSHYFFKEWWNSPYQKGGK